MVLKSLYTLDKYGWVRRGLQYGYPMCCILFFLLEWDDVKVQTPEFGSPEGIVRCPTCVSGALCKDLYM